MADSQREVPALLSVVRSHDGINTLDNQANDVPRGDVSPVDLYATPIPAPERIAAPAPRAAWSPREVAAHLIGGSHRGVARRGNLELRRITGDLCARFVLTDLRDDSTLTLTTSSAVVSAVGELL